MRGQGIQSFSAKDQCEQCTGDSIDHDDRNTKDQGLADAFSFALVVLQKESYRHGDHGENTGGNKGGKAKNKSQNHVTPE